MKNSDISTAVSPFYPVACVGPLLSVALFGCIFSIGTFLSGIPIYTVYFSEPRLIMEGVVLLSLFADFSVSIPMSDFKIVVLVCKLKCIGILYIPLLSEYKNRTVLFALCGHFIIVTLASF